jgi:GGDEF domain-containing protein
MMVRMNQDRILLIGDTDATVRAALAQAAPSALVTSVPTIFDGIAELVDGRFSAILLDANPLQRRPEAAVRSLRRVCGNTRLLLFGNAGAEPLAHRLIDMGCDDYLLSPPLPDNLARAISLSPSRTANAGPMPAVATEQFWPLPSATRVLETVLECLVHQPGNALPEVVHQVDAALTDGYRLALESNVPEESTGQLTSASSIDRPSIVRPLESGTHRLRLTLPGSTDRPINHPAVEQFLAELSASLSKIHQIDDRHQRLQGLAVTDELTGAKNCRYFRHFLSQIIEKARAMRFPVTLFLFDIDDFKSYNDRFGHSAGDEILRQTAALMNKCTRSHDLVARIGGDEFAVVFWEKDPPRQALDPTTTVPTTATPTLRVPQEPRQILQRFQRLLASEQFASLGPAGKGSLTISGGVAVFPWDAQDVNGLVEFADKKLVFGAKRAGKNTVHLVGAETPPPNQDKPAQ